MLRILTGLLLVLWPFLVWFSLTHPQYRWLLPLMALLFVLRWLGLRHQVGAFAAAGKWLAVAGAGLCAASMLLRDHHLLLWYPVAVNAILLLLFASSLFSAMPLVERLARLREAELPPRAVAYTRRVTQVWCLFFLFNGGVALVTCLQNTLLWWTWWNGLISYLLIGLLMAGEWCVRQRIRASR
ncbi:hypothetical protein [Erwinia sorbitola]|uniref:DNA gyrase subunit B n=1 Tax=Erwinia sorbitola TaxID=2681984 RepID=A0A6I6EJ93_9GAMM|nr:hypothetical protein [Erwinia sorbitola]QGU88075.1 DNA gyrase subunit B [Erwinia sorbitola]